jgi:NADH:ubiquinone oxidoreductase subunit E
MERTQDTSNKYYRIVDEPINELISHYPADKRKSALPVLHEVQDAHENWLSTELMDKVAEIIKYYQLRCMRWYLLHYVQSKKPVSICLNFVKHHPVASTERRILWITPVKN